MKKRKGRPSLAARAEKKQKRTLEESKQIITDMLQCPVCRCTKLHMFTIMVCGHPICEECFCALHIVGEDAAMFNTTVQYSERDDGLKPVLRHDQTGDNGDWEAKCPSCRAVFTEDIVELADPIGNNLIKPLPKFLLNGLMLLCQDTTVCSHCEIDFDSHEQLAKHKFCCDKRKLYRCQDCGKHVTYGEGYDDGSGRKCHHMSQHAKNSCVGMPPLYVCPKNCSVSGSTPMATFQQLLDHMDLHRKKLENHRFAIKQISQTMFDDPTKDDGSKLRSFLSNGVSSS